MRKVSAVALDFESVICQMQDDNKIRGLPIPGIRRTIDRIRENGFQVVVVSSRCDTLEGIAIVEDYLEKHDIIVDDVRYAIPACACYVSDRAIRFDGNTVKLLSEIGSIAD